MKAPRPILVCAEWARGEPTSLTLELLAAARALAGESGGEVAALAPENEGCARELIARGADEIFTFSLPPAAPIDAEGSLAALELAARQCAPVLILVPHTSLGADVAPRLAFRLETAAATGCIGIARGASGFLFTRSRQGGIAREVLSIRSAPAIATVRAGCHEAAMRNPQRTGRVTPLACDVERMPRRTRVIERQRDDDSGALRLEDAKVIVAGGRGLDGPDGFRVLERLADTLGGAVGASRVPCDLGWCPRAWQIGLTGKTVTPELYIAVGISGAGHHMAGCGNSKAIVAVNTDPAAAIFREARYGIVGDYRQVVPALIEELRKGRENHGV